MFTVSQVASTLHLKTGLVTALCLFRAQIACAVYNRNKFRSNPDGADLSVIARAGEIEHIAAGGARANGDNSANVETDGPEATELTEDITLPDDELEAALNETLLETWQSLPDDSVGGGAGNNLEPSSSGVMNSPVGAEQDTNALNSSQIPPTENAFRDAAAGNVSNSFMSTMQLEQKLQNSIRSVSAAAAARAGHKSTICVVSANTTIGYAVVKTLCALQDASIVVRAVATQESKQHSFKYDSVMFFTHSRLQRNATAASSCAI